MRARRSRAIATSLFLIVSWLWAQPVSATCDEAAQAVRRLSPPPPAFASELARIRFADAARLQPDLDLLRARRICPISRSAGRLGCAPGRLCGAGLPSLSARRLSVTFRQSYALM